MILLTTAFPSEWPSRFYHSFSFLFLILFYFALFTGLLWDLFRSSYEIDANYMNIAWLA